MYLAVQPLGGRGAPVQLGLPPLPLAQVVGFTDLEVDIRRSHGLVQRLVAVVEHMTGGVGPRGGRDAGVGGGNLLGVTDCFKML